jgi:hypothetical protein
MTLPPPELLRVWPWLSREDTGGGGSLMRLKLSLISSLTWARSRRSVPMRLSSMVFILSANLQQQQQQKGGMSYIIMRRGVSDQGTMLIKATAWRRGHALTAL